MKKSFLMSLVVVAFSLTTACAQKQSNDAQVQNEQQEKTKVYFVEDITPESLIKVYEALGRSATGKVAVKISTGEQGGNNYLKPELIGDFVKKVNGILVECNTAYGGSRQETDKHRQTIANHGFDKISKVDIMDENGEVSISVPSGSHMLKKDIVGKNLLNYDFMVVLSHFKGHAMGGFGGALKNLSIGCASTNGKVYIHTGGKDEQLNSESWSKHLAGTDEFKDAMAEAAGAVVKHFGDKILYINVINNLSVDCDCDSHPAEPKMKHVGIVASLDPVALDQACVDMVFNSNDPGNRDLVERIVSRHGTRILYWAQKINVGSRDYELEHVK